MEPFVKIADPGDRISDHILYELAINLEKRFGSYGRDAFSDWQYNNPAYIFAIAFLGEEVVGCGAIRPIWENTGEVRRMYAKYPGKKIGQSVLEFLENAAKTAGYQKLVLETRARNETAISFYQRNGYEQIPNYGKYIDRPEAVCLKKIL